MKQTSRKIEFVWQLPLVVPVFLFVISIYIHPTIVYDSAVGFLVLRSMMEGAPFNFLTSPDPANIANDVSTFVSAWSPGQYLVPGALIWCGVNYKLACSLTVLASTIIGVAGWAQVARNFSIKPLATFVFLFGLVSFRYSTLSFQSYHGGEVLLFAAVPWCLYFMWHAVDKPPAVCFAICLLSLTFLVVAKLTGVIVFAANVVAITVLEFVRHRRITSSTLAMWSASCVGALFFVVFWLARVPPAVTDSGGTIHSSVWAAVGRAFWFPMAASAFSGVSGIDFIGWIVHREWAPTIPNVAIYLTALFGVLFILWVLYHASDARHRTAIVGVFAIIAFVISALAAIYNIERTSVHFEQRQLQNVGLVLIALSGDSLAFWVWSRLRNTSYRIMTIFFFAIIVFYAGSFAAMYLRGILGGIPGGVPISLDERHLRYPGILFFLLFMVAIDQLGTVIAKRIALIVFGVFAIYSLVSYAVYAQELTRGRSYDSINFTWRQAISPVAIQYLQAQMTEHSWEHAIVVVPSPEVGLDLPRFRVLSVPIDFGFVSAEMLSRIQYRGRVSKIFVIVQNEIEGKAEALLKCFVDYQQDQWSKIQFGDTVIYSQ